MKCHILCLISILIVGTLVTSASAQGRHLRKPNARQAIENAMHEYANALHNGSPESIAACYTTEGELLLPGLAPLHGREAIINFLKPLADLTEVESVDVTTELIEVHGNSATQWGTYQQVAGEKGKPKQTYRGRYAALWQLDGLKHWRFVRLMMQPM